MSSSDSGPVGREFDRVIRGLSNENEELRAIAAEMRAFGDEMAAAVQERWTGPGGCDCRVCQAAKAWIAYGKDKQA